MAQETKLQYEFGPFRLDARERQLWRNGEVVPLTPKVFDILLVLVENSGHILGKDEIIKLVWPDAIVEEGNLTRNVSTLRKALGESSDEPQYIETIPWRGYRFVATVREAREDGASLSEEERRGSSSLIQAEAPHTPKRRTRTAWLAALVGLVIAISFIAYFVTRGQMIDSVAVLPFVNETNDPSTEYLPDGITDSLIKNLSQLTRLKVMSHNSVFRYKDQNAQTSPPDIPRVGRELGVRSVLTGRVAQHGETLLISVELVDTRDNRHIWGEQYTRKLTDLFTMPETISRDIAEKLRVRLTGEETRRLAKRDTENTEAYQLYLRGRYHLHRLTPDGVQKAIEHFQQAIVKDPNYEWLNKAYQERNVQMISLRVDPVLTSLRADARFADLLRRLNLTP